MTHLLAFAGFYLAAVLLLSSALKARHWTSPEAALRSGLGAVVRGLRLLALVWRALVVVEAGLAVALLALPARGAGVAAAAFFVAAAAYAAVLIRLAPDRSCGCFGAGDEPASPLVVLRALLLACVAGGYAAVAPGQVFGDSRAWIGLLLLVAATLAVSREWRRPFQRRAAARRRRACARAAVEVAPAMELVRAAKAWRTLEDYLVRDEPTETWREGCWQFLSFEASYGGGIATAVFALGLVGRRRACRALLRRGFTGGAILETPEERLPSRRRRRTAAPPPAPARA